MSKYPPIQIVDDNDQPIGGASMAEAYAQGLKHRVVIIFVQNESGQLLLQKRGPGVATYANCWDVSAAGHVDEGEDYLTAAKRELQEELGITGYPLEQLESMYAETFFDDGRQVKRFRTAYKVLVPSDIALQSAADEVSDLRWMAVPELKRFIAEHPSAVHADLESLVTRLFPA